MGEQEEPESSLVGQSLTRLTRTLSAIGSLMIMGLMVGINADVGGRYFFNSPIPGTAEVISASIVSIIFLQLPDCVRKRRMIRSGVLIDRLLERRPRLGETAEAVLSFVGFAMLCIMVYYLVPAVSKAWTARHTIGVPGIFTAPIWPFYLLVLLGAALATIEYGRLCIKYLTRIRVARE